MFLVFAISTPLTLKKRERQVDRQRKRQTYTHRHRDTHPSETKIAYIHVS